MPKIWPASRCLVLDVHQGQRHQKSRRERLVITSRQFQPVAQDPNSCRRADEVIGVKAEPNIATRELCRVFSRKKRSTGSTCRPLPSPRRRPGGALRSSRIRHQRALPAPWIGQRTNPRPGDVARRPLAWKAPRAHDLLLALRAPEVPPSIAVVAPERRRNVPISGFRTSGWFVSRR